MRLIIMRGVPSSGKSTRAKELAGPTGEVFSTDEFFYVVEEPEKFNKYSFNPNRLGEAHRWNLKRAKEAMDSKSPLIVIDNTNVKKFEPEAYILHGIEAGYEVSFEEPNSPHWIEMREVVRKKDKDGIKEWSEFLAELSKKSHNVPQHAIERMMNNWEEFTIEDFTKDDSLGKSWDAKGYKAPAAQKDLLNEMKNESLIQKNKEKIFKRMSKRIIEDPTILDDIKERLLDDDIVN